MWRIVVGRVCHGRLCRAKQARIKGAAVVTNPLMPISLAFSASSSVQKALAELSEGALKQEVKRLKKIKAANWSLVVDLYTVQRHRAQKMQEALKKK